MIDETLKALLISYKDKDFELREKLMKQGLLYEGYNSQLEALHLENAEKLNEIIKAHGWPGQSKVGKEGAYAAFILAQHAISRPPLQKYFFEKMSASVKMNEASPRHAACLEDRILFNQAKPLKYGMLFDWNEAGIFTTNVDDVELANQRRKEIGLESIEEATINFRKEVEQENAGPRPDYHEHKRLEKEWAIRVGWL